jgi:hypothetical protein
MVLKQVTKQENKNGANGANGAQGGSSNSATNGSSSAAAGKTGAFIARQAGGLCFDFNPKDSNMYEIIHRIVFLRFFFLSVN